jgi:hypothetical protein
MLNIIGIVIGVLIAVPLIIAGIGVLWILLGDNPEVI